MKRAPAIAGAFLIALGADSWRATVGITAAVAVSTDVVFKHWLGMELPGGPFGI